MIKFWNWYYLELRKLLIIVCHLQLPLDLPIAVSEMSGMSSIELRGGHYFQVHLDIYWGSPFSISYRLQYIRFAIFVCQYLLTVPIFLKQLHKMISKSCENSCNRRWSAQCTTRLLLQSSFWDPNQEAWNTNITSNNKNANTDTVAPPNHPGEAPIILGLKPKPFTTEYDGMKLNNVYNPGPKPMTFGPGLQGLSLLMAVEKTKSCNRFSIQSSGCT